MISTTCIWVLRSILKMILLIHLHFPYLVQRKGFPHEDFYWKDCAKITSGRGKKSLKPMMLNLTNNREKKKKSLSDYIIKALSSLHDFLTLFIKPGLNFSWIYLFSAISASWWKLPHFNIEIIGLTSPTCKKKPTVAV